jgi:hypothetical protein
MEKKQFNVGMPLFAHDDFSHVQRALREIGIKPEKGDLVAALIYAAKTSGPEKTKALVEAWVVYELALEDEAGG